MSISALILAAGYSSRCEKYKMTLPYGDSTVIEHAIKPFLGLVDEIIVVTGYNSELIMKLLLPYDSVKVIYNEEYKEGMFSSVVCGLKEVSGDVLITPGDYPNINRSTVACLIETHGNFVLPSMDMKCGHPIRLSRDLVKHILKKGKGSLKESTKGFKRTYAVVVDEGIFQDIDTMEDYMRMRRDAL